MQWYLHVLRNYATFSGRARRKEFWMFALFNFIIAMVLTIIGMVAFGSNSGASKLLADLYELAVLVPSLAVSVRRLHDTGRSGWWLLIALVPFVGAIVLLIFDCLDSEPGDNKWGPNPKHTDLASSVATV